MYEWNQKFTRAKIEAYIIKKEGVNHLFIDEIKMARANLIKHKSLVSFWISYNSNRS